MKNLIDILLEGKYDSNIKKVKKLSYMKPFEGILPKKLYHVSNPAFRSNIEKVGLQPQLGDSYTLHWESEWPDFETIPCVFLATNNDYDSTYDDDRYEVDTKYIDKKKLYYDISKTIDDEIELEKEWFMYFDEIPPKALKLIYKGTDK